MMRQWFVTGASKGLGRAIVETALQAGDRVAATARNVAPLDDLVSRYPRTLTTFVVDVTDEDAVDAAVRRSAEPSGAIDIVVNNAGYATIAPFEQMSSEAFRAEIETNLFGTVNTIRAVLPSMRERRGGRIFNISSVGGRVGAPGLSAYQSAKWAVSGLSEILSRETEPFGVKVVAIEPGGMRTDWGATAFGSSKDIIAEYRPSVGAFLDRMPAFVGNEIGDPMKVAAVLLDLSKRDDLPDHLVLGSDALAVLDAAEANRSRDAEKWREVGRSTDFGAGDPETH